MDNTATPIRVAGGSILGSSLHTAAEVTHVAVAVAHGAVFCCSVRVQFDCFTSSPSLPKSSLRPRELHPRLHFVSFCAHNFRLRTSQSRRISLNNGRRFARESRTVDLLCVLQY